MGSMHLILYIILLIDPNISSQGLFIGSFYCKNLILKLGIKEVLRMLWLITCLGMRVQALIILMKSPFVFNSQMRDCMQLVKHTFLPMQISLITLLHVLCHITSIFIKKKNYPMLSTICGASHFCSRSVHITL